jgi:hypothetical protein
MTIGSVKVDRPASEVVDDENGISAYRDPSSCTWGYTPLRAAVLVGNIELVRALILREADVNEQACVLGFTRGIHEAFPSKLTILQMVCWAWWFRRYENFDFTHFAYMGSISHGVSPYVTHERRVEIAKLLLESGADVNPVVGPKGVSALQLAAESGDIQLCTLLLEYGATVNASSCSLAGIPLELDWDEPQICDDLIYPLDSAAYYGRLDVVQLLLNCGAQSFYQRATPYDGAIRFAKQEGQAGVVDILFGQRDVLVSATEWETRFGDFTRQKRQNSCDYGWRLSDRFMPPGQPVYIT